MQPNDFVYLQVYRGSKKNGASEMQAHKHAVIALDIFKKNKFSGKASDLIKMYQNMAIRESKIGRRK